MLSKLRKDMDKVESQPVQQFIKQMLTKSVSKSLSVGHMKVAQHVFRLLLAELYERLECLGNEERMRPTISARMAVVSAWHPTVCGGSCHQSHRFTFTIKPLDQACSDTAKLEKLLKKMNTLY